MGERIGTEDWSKSVLGPLSTWPQWLRTVLGLCLESPVPTVIWWTPDLFMLYNDAYRLALGSDQQALGSQGRHLDPEVWDAIGPMVRNVFAQGQAIQADDQRLLLEHDGYLEERFFTFAHSPIRDETGVVCGVLTVANERTESVLAERRLATLRRLATVTTEAQEVDAICRAAAQVFAGHGADLPFVLIYLLDEDRHSARLAGIAGLAPADPVAIERIDLTVPQRKTWPLDEASSGGQGIWVSDLPSRFEISPDAPSALATPQALVFPISSSLGASPMGFLIAGLCGSRVQDDAHQQFLGLLARQLGTAIDSLRARRAFKQGNLPPQASSVRNDGEERLRLARAQQSAGVGIWDWDIRTGKIEWSPELFHLFGLDPTQTVASFESWRSVVHPDDRQAADERISAAVRSHMPLQSEYRIVLPTGEVRWIKALGDTRYDGQGEPLDMAGFFLDITDWKRAELALRESQEEQQLILDSMPAMIWYKDTANRILRVNQLAADSLGLPKEQIEGRSTAEFYPHEADRYYRDDFMVAQTGLPRLGIEEPYRLPSGETRWVLTDKVPLKDASGQVTRILAMAVDITERKRTEEALRLSEERFRKVFEHAGIGIAITDWEGHLLQCNPAYCALLGYTQEELSQIVFFDLVHPEDRAANLAAIRRLQHEELPFFETENRYEGKDGKSIWVRKFVSLLRDESDRPARLVVLVTDMTERRRMEEALHEAGRRKDEFLATLAHELRNPLAPIRNALQLLQLSAGKDAAAVARVCEIMERQVAHMVRLIDDLLEVSRITRGKIELKKESVALTAIIDSAVEISRPLIEAGHHRLTVSLPPEPLILDADPVRLSQAFTNLLNNAAKYTEAGGQIGLTAKREADQAVVSVHDTGVGIPTALLPRVFDLFTQIDPGLGRVQSGLGIGLALARSLVELHGGRVDARSEGTGQGSEFIVYLPLAAAQLADEVPPKAPHPRLDSKPRILVVDDNTDSADSLGMLLSALGAETHVVYNGMAALEALDVFAPDLVILDLGMPRMDGCEVARQIRKQPRYHNLPLIALTGWGQEADRQRSRSAGFDHHLVKPVDMDVLRKLLASVKTE